MSAAANHRGGAPVGHVANLGPVEAGAVLCLRCWAHGSGAKSQMRHDFAATLGAEKGQQALGAFEELFSLCARHARRPLMHHSLGCKCLGADESCFAHFVGYASEGAREDALMIATTLVNPAVAPLLVGLAEDFGHALRSMAKSPAPTHENPKTLH